MIRELTRERRGARSLLRACAPLLFVALIVAAKVSAQVPVRIEAFDRDVRVGNLEVAGQSMIEILKRETRRVFVKDTAFVEASSAIIVIRGRINDFEYKTDRVNAAGEVLQKTAKITVDLQILDERSAQELATSKNVIHEFQYYTETYAIDHGKTDREAVEENLLVTLAEKVRAFAVENKSKLDTAIAPVKSIELEDDEKDALGKIGERPIVEAPAEKIFSGSLSVENQAIRITSGTLLASGAQERNTNRFLSTGTLKMAKKLKNESRLDGILSAKANSDAKLPAQDLYLERYELDYVLNEANTFRVGTVNPVLSSYVFERTVDGLHYTGQRKFGTVSHELDLFGGREFNADGTGIRPRNSFGAAWSIGLGPKGNLRVLGSTTRDHRTIIEAGNVIRKIDNRIFGATGRYKSSFGPTMDFSALSSSHRDNIMNDTSVLEGDLYQVKLKHAIRSLDLNAEYYRADADYRTVLGSVSTDKERKAASARLPFEWKVFDVTLNSSWNRSSRLLKRERWDVTHINGGELGVKPFRGDTTPFLKDLKLSAATEFRRNFDDVVIAGVVSSKNLRVQDFSLGATNTFYDIYTLGLKRTDNIERNRITGERLEIKEHTFENRLAIADWKGVAAELSAKFRRKETNGRPDRYVTMGAKMSQKIGAFNWQFDYLHDLTRGLIRLQDTTKNRFTLDMGYAPKLPKVTGSFGVNLDYERNGFGDITKDYDRFTTTATARFAF